MVPHKGWGCLFYFWKELSFCSYPGSPESHGPQKARLNWESKGKATAKGMMSYSFIYLFCLYLHVSLGNRRLLPCHVMYISVISGPRFSVLELGSIFYLQLRNKRSPTPIFFLVEFTGNLQSTMPGFAALGETRCPHK